MVGRRGLLCLEASFPGGSWLPPSPPPNCLVSPIGDLAATIKSCEVVDACVKDLLAAADLVNARCGDWCEG